MAEKEVVLLPAGTIIEAGDPPPPTKSTKAMQAGFWAGVPIFFGIVVNVFQQLGTIPGAPDWLLRTSAYVLMVAGPILAYAKVRTAQDQLEQPIETIEGTSLDGRPIVVVIGEPHEMTEPPAPVVEATAELPIVPPEGAPNTDGTAPST